MFEQKKNKNRKLTSKEKADNLKNAIIQGKYPKTYKNKCYYYKNMNPKPLVNFSLNFNF